MYLNPSVGESVFVDDNKPRQDIDLYLCSVYTRGWEAFKAFSLLVGDARLKYIEFAATKM